MLGKRTKPIPKPVKRATETLRGIFSRPLHGLHLYIYYCISPIKPRGIFFFNVGGFLSFLFPRPHPVGQQGGARGGGREERGEGSGGFFSGARGLKSTLKLLGGLAGRYRSGFCNHWPSILFARSCRNPDPTCRDHLQPAARAFPCAGITFPCAGIVFPSAESFFRMQESLFYLQESFFRVQESLFHIPEPFFHVRESFLRQQI